MGFEIGHSDHRPDVTRPAPTRRLLLIAALTAVPLLGVTPMAFADTDCSDSDGFAPVCVGVDPDVSPTVEDIVNILSFSLG